MRFWLIKGLEVPGSSMSVLVTVANRATGVRTSFGRNPGSSLSFLVTVANRAKGDRECSGPVLVLLWEVRESIACIRCVREKRARDLKFSRFESNTGPARIRASQIPAQPARPLLRQLEPVSARPRPGPKNRGGRGGSEQPTLRFGARLAFARKADSGLHSLGTTRFAASVVRRGAWRIIVFPRPLMPTAF